MVLRRIMFCVLACFTMASKGGQQEKQMGATLTSDYHWMGFRSFAPVISDHHENVVNTDKNHIVLPLKRAGNLILLEAIIDGVSGNLILDSGSSSLVLNSMYFRHGQVVASLAAGGVTGTTGTLVTTRINSMQISDMKFNRLEANTVDLGHIESARNIRVLGFFGLGLFNDYEIVLDLQNSVLELHRLNIRGNRMSRVRLPSRFDLQIPATVKSNVLFFSANINRARLTFCLDTGAESNVLTSTLPNHILNTVDINRRSTIRGASGHDVEVLYGLMNNLDIERTDLAGMQVMIMNLNTMSHFYGMQIDGMLGCEFLEKGVFYINLKQERIGIVFYKD